MSTHKKSVLIVAMWLLCVAVVFAFHWSYLFKGFYVEDERYLGMVFEPTEPGMIAVIGSLSDFLNFFRFDREWYYRPFALMYFAVLHAFTGDNPVWFHAASLALHGSVIFTTALLVHRLTRNHLASFFAAAMFLLWPYKEQAVWWIASSSTSLSTLLALISVHAWLSYRQTARTGFYALSLLAALIAAGVKTEGALVLPILVAIEMATPSKLRRDWWRLVPYLVIALTYFKLEGLTAKASGTSFLDAEMMIHKARAFPEFVSLMVGYPGWLTFLLIVVLVYRNSPPESRKLSIAFAGVSAACALAFVAAVGWFTTINDRFFYMPLVFAACGVAVLFFPGGKEAARYLVGGAVAIACTLPFQNTAVYLFPYVAEVCILAGALVVALALRKHQKHCEAMYPSLVAVAFIAFTDQLSPGLTAMCLAPALLIGTFMLWNHRLGYNPKAHQLRRKLETSL